MTVESGTFARSTTGNATYILNTVDFTPSLILFFVSGETSGDTETHLAIGYGHGAVTDGTLQTSSGKASETRTKTLSHYEGTTERIAFTLTNIDVEEFTVNYTAADVNYNIHFIAIGD